MIFNYTPISTFLIVYRFHAFDIARNNYADAQANKENIKISIRKNDSCTDDKLNEVMKEQANKNGFEIRRLDFRPGVKKM